MSETETRRLRTAMAYICEHRNVSKLHLDNFNRHLTWLKPDQHWKRSALRARKILRSVLSNVYYGIGLEAFMLCAISMPPNTLSRLNPDSFLSHVRRWWRKQTPSQLQYLEQIASIICKCEHLESLLGQKPAHLAITEAISNADTSTDPYAQSFFGE